VNFARRVGINPLPWILGDGGYRLDRDVLTTAMTELAAVGFTHVTVELPPETTAKDYEQLLYAHGLAAAPGYFSAPFWDRAEHPAAIEGIKRHAAAHLELGLNTAFIATDLTPDRIQHPAVGYGPDPERTKIVAEGLAAAAATAAAEGVRYGLHPHVGSAVETESEVRQVLDTTAGSDLWFGPDTGHLRWADALPEVLVADYRDRIINVHLKDVDGRAASTARSSGEDYMAATGKTKVWTEPGRGDVDFDAVLAALPTGFDGWFIIEVDVPNIGTATESSAASLAFLSGHDYFTRHASE
jgi:inosose dehydratase